VGPDSREEFGEYESSVEGDFEGSHLGDHFIVVDACIRIRDELGVNIVTEEGFGDLIDEHTHSWHGMLYLGGYLSGKELILGFVMVGVPSVAFAVGAYFDDEVVFVFIHLVN
jgi:hypothetical protein